MLHDIKPKSYHVEYSISEPKPEDTIIMFDADEVCCRLDGNETTLPKLCEFSEMSSIKTQYLFSIDDERYFMPVTDKSAKTAAISIPDGYQKQSFGIFRTIRPQHLAFAVITARQLCQWYDENKYCGGCGEEMAHAEHERAKICKKCGITVYPKISPVVIVAVTRGEDLLVTRYRDRPVNFYALVAGFVEIGESLEDTVRREVLEETGIRVKNLRYYKSQPWGFSSSLLSGFICELDGDPLITLDENELSEALWLPRGEIPPANNEIALTAEMMEAFRTGKI